MANMNEILFYKKVNEVIKEKLLKQVDMDGLLSRFEETQKLLTQIEGTLGIFGYTYLRLK